jgi:pimeloyl-ACP methyl ester carboxylesterase
MVCLCKRILLTFLFTVISFAFSELTSHAQGCKFVAASPGKLSSTDRCSPMGSSTASAGPHKFLAGPERAFCAGSTPPLISHAEPEPARPQFGCDPATDRWVSGVSNYWHGTLGKGDFCDNAQNGADRQTAANCAWNYTISKFGPPPTPTCARNAIENSPQGIADLGAVVTKWQQPGAGTIATNYRIIDPTPAVEPCDSSANGYYLPRIDLLDWTPTEAPPFEQIATGYRPEAGTTGKLGGIPAGGLNEGRLRADLRDAAKEANPNKTLCSAAAAFALGNPVDGNAFADLSVTGLRTFKEFRAHPPQTSDILFCARQKLSNSGIADAQVKTAVDMALNRAYLVLGIVRAGGWPTACPQRDALLPQYIAVSGEDDHPHRPVNVPSAEFPQFDLDVNVPRPFGLPPLTVHTRYMIAHTTPPQGAKPTSCAPTGRTVPVDQVPMLAPDAEVILFIHGQDSRLEEALSVTRQIRALGLARHQNYTVISMDLPTSGYADNVDHTIIAPLSVDGRAKGDLSLIELGIDILSPLDIALAFRAIQDSLGLEFDPDPSYRVPILDFDEDFIVAFVKKLDETLGMNHPLTSHPLTVVGGSLGGNLSMRLGRPRPDAPWISKIVSWSPASIWPSMSDDPIKHAALAVPWYLAGGDPAHTREDPGQRRAWFYGGYEWTPEILFTIKPDTGQPQAQLWYDCAWACKGSYIRLGRLERYETYDKNFRLWHWRLGMEQFIFSHRSNNPRTAQPWYLSNTKPMLLMCGMDDAGGGLCASAREVAPKMNVTQGFALFLNSTGHSIHAERPNFLARHVVDFIDGVGTPPPGVHCAADAECDPGSYCDAKNSGGTCTLRQPMGAGCSANVQCSSAYCDAGDGTSRTGRCMPGNNGQIGFGQLGDICSNDNQCRTLVCEGLHQDDCGWVPGTCADKMPLGATCSQNYHCSSGHCDAGDGTSKTDKCMPNKNGQPGQICSDNNQCSSLICAGLHQDASGAWVPGTCADKMPLGATCSQNYECGSGYCDTGNGTSKTNKCMPNNNGQIGDPCSNNNQCTTLICGGLHQDTSGAWVPGKCADKMSLGAICSQNYECGSGYCDAGNGTSKTNKCMPNNNGQIGDPCSNNNQCTTLICGGLHQDTSGAWVPGNCASKKLLGDACSQNYQCSSNYCDTGNGTSRTDKCMPNNNGQTGDICSHPNQCTSHNCIGLHLDGGNWIPGKCE